MSILIKGMEMPKDQPLRIVLNPNGQLFVDHSYYFTEYETVEVPKHGRLIDADELKANIHMEGYRGYRARYDGAVTTFNYINDATTIIEAEE